MERQTVIVHVLNSWNIEVINEVSICEGCIFSKGVHLASATSARALVVFLPVPVAGLVPK